MDDAQRQRGQQWLTKLLQLMEINAAVNITKVEVESDATTACWLTIDESSLSEEQVGLLIGDQGETIDSIQYLANAILHIGLDKEKSGYFMIDIDDYRGQRQAQLQVLAEEVAEQVRQTGQEVEMKSLSSVERRQIHSILSQDQDLQTESRGHEPDRRLVVRLR
ncbi:R3H domain-containing nucleic acid-binding protein [Gloeocapsa sp. PCC 73106]|uniref:Jag family protein n=1 Tax=Gloeocapsa sp. PCC 73106 TaxID=102232 RepID=UPI0002ABB21B|nr:R3H domain-containing nucleic acid-binding protein [Gloeocapsa sp. PCC 73106]ELR98021.1 putative RNA-binding protein [Gloeocapsa sp. PCC 73106]